jgi:hypothetical protein
MVMLLISILLITKSSFAQVNNGFPNPSSCNSKDVELISAMLCDEEEEDEDEDECNKCKTGSIITKTLSFKVNNKSGSKKTSFAFWGNLEIYDGNTGLLKSSTPIKDCAGPFIEKSVNTFNFQNITYSCGDIVKITNLYMDWSDASKGSTCDKIISSNIEPKCETLPSITINTGLNAELIVSNLLCFRKNNHLIPRKIKNIIRNC